MHISPNKPMTSVAVKRCRPGAEGRSEPVSLGSIYLRPRMPSELPEHIRSQLTPAEAAEVLGLLKGINAKVEFRIRVEVQEAMMNAVEKCESAFPSPTALSAQDAVGLRQIASMLHEAAGRIEAIQQPVAKDLEAANQDGETPTLAEVISDSR